MSEPRTRDVFDTLLRDRITDLEARLQHALLAADPAAPCVPFEWGLDRAQAVLAVCLARGPVALCEAAVSLDAGLPGGWGQAGGVARAVAALAAGLDRALGAWGWILTRPDGGLLRMADRLAIHPAQQAPFRAAVRFEGSPATGPIQHRRIPPGTRAYRGLQMQAGGGA
ncbi:hypothetical protein [Maricaulis maris]|uniref:Uncharacterized protein n=1 Tax=Maricaulis maris TaxID=74318 RepID=A0A495D1P6_9PROT|nr:hypothetical protein [Maricaulis maris]RKQ95437.1 hypothetical protein C7435_2539 [Maricaulis maris]